MGMLAAGSAGGEEDGAGQRTLSVAAELGHQEKQSQQAHHEQGHDPAHGNRRRPAASQAEAHAKEQAGHGDAGYQPKYAEAGLRH